jgi:hypothetical protein
MSELSETKKRVARSPNESAQRWLGQAKACMGLAIVEAGVALVGVGATVEGIMERRPLESIVGLTVAIASGRASANDFELHENRLRAADEAVANQVAYATSYNSF